MSLRGLFDPKAGRGKDKSASKLPQLNAVSSATCEEVASSLQKVGLEATQITDIKYYMLQAGIDANNDIGILNDLAKAERTIKELPYEMGTNLDCLSTIYQLVPRRHQDATANFRTIHHNIMTYLVPGRLTEAATAILTYGQANDTIKLELLLNINHYLDALTIFNHENPSNAAELFRALINQTIKTKLKLEMIITGLKSFYKLSKKKIASPADLQLIIQYIHDQSREAAFAFNKKSALITLYFYDMLTKETLAQAAINKDFVPAVMICATYYQLKEYAFPPYNTLRKILTNLDLANYLVVIGEYLKKQMKRTTDNEAIKKEFLQQIYALLYTGYACNKDMPPPNPHNARFEDEKTHLNTHVKNSLESTFAALLEYNNIDKFGTKLPVRKKYNWYY